MLLQSSPDKVMITDSDVWFCKFVFLCPEGHRKRRVPRGVELAFPPEVLCSSLRTARHQRKGRVPSAVND